jgi:hypothetical protein
VSDSGTGKELSVFSPDVASAVECAVQRLPDVVVLHRFSRAAGRRDWYVVRSRVQFREAIERGRPGDSYSIFLRPELPLRGPIGQSFASRFEHLLRQVEVPKTEVIMGEVVNNDPLLHDTEGWSPHEIGEARAWLQEHWGRFAVAGLHPDLFAPSREDVLTAYVPESDGRVRPGVY